jgi:phosphoribosylformylglycinamidine synthase
MAARIGVVTFPGSLDDGDACRAVRLAGGEPVPLWHGSTDMQDVAAVVLPGGFAFGDYLRPGAIARFSPIMQPIVAAARDGLPVLGICNGFQVLCESHLLPGALIRNAGRRFVCHDQTLRLVNNATAWTGGYTAGAELIIPIKNMDGQFVANEHTLDMLEAEGRIVARYVHRNPNGSYRDVAGITNETGTIVGLMPHPEHAIDSLTGPGTDGLGFFTSILRTLVPA